MLLDREIEKSLIAMRRQDRRLRQLPALEKNKLLQRLATAVEQSGALILAANKIDLDKLSNETSSAFRDRLTLNAQRLHSMSEGLRAVAKLEDPVGELVEAKELPNGLRLKRIRWPLGIILLIFESRPNVILEAFSLAFKTGNSLILRGGSDSRTTSQVIYKVMRETLSESGLGGAAFYAVENYERSLVEILLQRKDLIDIVVPRGGDQLIDFVQRTAQMPIIKNDRGLCHTYVDEDADLNMAARIVHNAKTQRPGVCNSLETVLVHKNCARAFILKLYQDSQPVGLQWRVDPQALEILKGLPRVQLAVANDWNTEHLDLIVNCRVVDDLNQALDHIELHGSKHSEAIVTTSEAKARRFQTEVDAAAVYWNASTRFTDGFEFGLGGELGISTQKLHVRGPVGLRELTTPRWIIDGTGQIR